MSVRPLLAAAFGLLIPLALAAPVQSAPHRHRPAAHVRTATYKVATPARPHQHLRAAKPARKNVAQAHRHHSIRRS